MENSSQKSNSKPSVMYFNNTFEEPLRIKET